MKLINPRQQAQIRLRFEIAASAILSTVLVCVTAFLTSPFAYGLFQANTVA